MSRPIVNNVWITRINNLNNCVLRHKLLQAYECINRRRHENLMTKYIISKKCDMKFENMKTKQR